MVCWLHCYGSALRQNIMVWKVMAEQNCSPHVRRERENKIYPSSACPQWHTSSIESPPPAFLPHVIVYSDYASISGWIHRWGHCILMMKSLLQIPTSEHRYIGNQAFNTSLWGDTSYPTSNIQIFWPFERVLKRHHGIKNVGFGVKSWINSLFCHPLAV